MPAVPPRLPAALTVPNWSLNRISRRPISAVPFTSRSGGASLPAPHEIATSSECLAAGHGGGGVGRQADMYVVRDACTGMAVRRTSLSSTLRSAASQPVKRATHGTKLAGCCTIPPAHQQLWTPHGLRGHSLSEASLPVHCRSSIQMGPTPAPKKPRASTVPGPGRPSWRHLQEREQTWHAGHNWDPRGAACTRRSPWPAVALTRLLPLQA